MVGSDVSSAAVELTQLAAKLICTESRGAAVEMSRHGRYRGGNYDQLCVCMCQYQSRYSQVTDSSVTAGSID